MLFRQERVNTLVLRSRFEKRKDATKIFPAQQRWPSEAAPRATPPTTGHVLYLQVPLSECIQTSKALLGAEKVVQTAIFGRVIF